MKWEDLFMLNMIKRCIKQFLDIDDVNKDKPVTNENNVNIDTVDTIKIISERERMATDGQRRYCCRIVRTAKEKCYAIPAEFTEYYIYNLMTFKEAYTFIERYKGICLI
jgi:hypothetical protein